MRFVVDGNLVTSSTLTTGIDATLAAIGLAAGPAVVDEAVRVSGYRHARTTWTHSLADTTRTVSIERRPLRGRAGIDLVPRTTFAEAADLERLESLAVPEGAFPYDHTLEAIAAREGADVAEATAGNIFYATTGQDYAGERQGWSLWWSPLLLATMGFTSAALGVRYPERIHGDVRRGGA